MRDIAHSRKCRLALKSIADCYRAPSSCMGKHVPDVGGKCRIGVDVIFQLARCNAELDREAEDIDQFLSVVADKMRADEAVGRAIKSWTMRRPRRRSWLRTFQACC